jgi:hypothetical protein
LNILEHGSSTGRRWALRTEQGRAQAMIKINVEKQAKIASTWMNAEIKELFNETARARGYDDIISLCSYAVSENPVYRAEALAAVAWRDAVSACMVEIIDEIKSKNRSVPTRAAFLAALPTINWPKGDQE